MQLVLEASGPDGWRERRVFGAAGGRVGTAPDNDWVLPDDGGRLGRTHARFIVADGGFRVVCASPKGLEVNGALLRRGQHRPVRPGDRLRLAGLGIAVIDSAGTAVQLLDAFREGAGLPRRAVAEDAAPHLLREEGALLRAALLGLHVLMQAEQTARRELGIPLPPLQPSANNPLRHLEDPATALQALVDGGRPGYLAGRAAVEGTVEQLALAQLATIRGLQAALHGLLEQFAPAEFERQAHAGTVARVMPAVHKARCWDLFVAAHARLGGDLADRFRTLFGPPMTAAFAAADRTRSRR